MGLSDVLTQVQQGAQDQAAAIIAEAKAEADQIRAEAKAKADEYAASRAARAGADAEQILIQGRSSAEFEARKRVLQTESGLRAQMRDTVLAGFAGLPKATRDKHLKALVKQAQAVIPKGRVRGAKGDEKTLSASGYKWDGAADIAGGLLVESDDGRLRLDLSYETLLESQWRDLLRSEASLFE